MKQKALVSGQAVSASDGRLKTEKGVGRALLLTLLWCLLGLLLPRATVCGTYAPFGVGVAAVRKGGSFFI